MDPIEFYNQFAPLYHLVYQDWDKGIERQASQLDGIIRENWRSNISTILDVSCGIGTQALGLARLGHRITASDISPDAVRRAKKEAEKRGLSISFSVADMRNVSGHHSSQFDLVISGDNSVPHLLNDEDILLAFKQFYSCTRTGGGCLITVGDYEKEYLTKKQVKIHGIREEKGIRYVVFQTWHPDGQYYALTMYFVEDRGEAECATRALRSKYYAVGVSKLMKLMSRAGFEEVARLGNRFYQAIIVGKRKV